MTLREAITAYLSGLGGFVTATEIIDGVVAAGCTDGREVRSTLSRLLAAGEVTRYRDESQVGRAYVYSLATAEAKATAAKKSRPSALAAKKKPERAAAKDPAVAELEDQVQFLIKRNRRLLDLLGSIHDAVDFGVRNQLADEVRKIVANDRGYALRKTETETETTTTTTTTEATQC